MKHPIIIAVAIVWMVCLAEFAALASAACHVQHTGRVGATVMMLGWLGLTGLFTWKLARGKSTAASQ
jgi:hypothetical protein